MYQLHSLPGSSHRVLADLALRAQRSPVLDVGAAEGYLGRILGGKGIVLDAVEPDEQFAALARPYYRRLHQCKVEEADLQERYGAILLGDVLEHLTDPVGVLKRLTTHLAADGVVLASVPNVAHIAVRLMLLSGRFPRMDRGPLDRTHLHFFTRTTAEGMLGQAGLKVVERRGTCVPLADIVGPRLALAARVAHPAQAVALRVLPNLFAYQWVFLAAQASSEA